MSRLTSAAHTDPFQAPGRKAWFFVVMTAFISTMGDGLIGPVVPFLVQPYVRNPNDLAFVVGLLVSSYALCQFLAAPVLGALSDRYGRRPILLVCLLGTVIGYLLFGIGGAIWVLFLGRIIDGVTGGNVSTLLAYVADITPPEQRGQYFGKVGAVTGVGFILGPLIGGLLGQFGYAAPLFVAARFVLANTLWGWFFMPESLDAARRADKISAAQLNPFKQLADVLAMARLRWLLLAMFFIAVPFAALEGNLSVLAKDALAWQPAAIGALYFVFGIQDTFVQGVLVQRLLPALGDIKVALAGLVLEMLAYLAIALAAALASPAALVAGMVLFGFGEPMIGPSLGGLISRSVNAREQGRVQGSNQSLQALARMLGPLLGGELYASIGRASLYESAAVLVGLAMLLLLRSVAAIGTQGSHSQSQKG